MQAHDIKVSTKGFEPFVVQVQRPETLEEARGLGWTDEEIISHLNRDENSNVGNAARAALVASVEEGITDREKLQEIVTEACTRYENGERAIRTKGGAAAALGKAIKWATQSAEMTKAYTDAIVANGLEAANKAIMELYTEANPPKAKAATEVAKK